MTSPLAPFYAGMSDYVVPRWYPCDLPSSFLPTPLGLEPLMPRFPSCPRTRLGLELKPSVFSRTGRSVVDAGKLAGSEMSDKFQVIMNVSQFKPEEVSVKVVDKHIVIHGKHEEKADEHGFIMREFTRKYLLPESVDAEELTSTMSRNGILTVQAPLKMVEPPASNERVVPITIETSKDVTQKMTQ